MVRTSVSCSNCHAQGFNMVTDEVRPFVLANRLSVNRDEFEIIDEVYLDPAEFADVIAADSALYQTSLERAGLPSTGGDPVAGTYLRFNDELDLATAAGELGVTESDLRSNLNLLDPRLSVLRQTTVEREDFSDTFEESLCIMQIISQNAPDPNRCDQFLDD